MQAMKRMLFAALFALWPVAALAATLMLAPNPNQTFVTSSGTSYLSDKNGIIANVATTQDMIDLQTAGAQIISPAPPNLLFYRLAANFNSSADQQLNQTAWTGKFRVTKIVITNASTSLTTAAGGFYTAASKGGDAIVAAGQAYTSLAASNLALDATLNLATKVQASGTPLYLSLTTPQGAPVTADVLVYGDTYP